MKILLVDTDSEITENVQVTLNIKQPDWILSTINSEEQCLEIIKSSNCPDLVIMAMSLSNNSNLSLLCAIRSDSDVPVIVLSDDKNVETLVKAFDSGADDYIVSPFNKAIFIARLETLIRRRRWDFQAKTEKSADRTCIS